MKPCWPNIQSTVICIVFLAFSDLSMHKIISFFFRLAMPKKPRIFPFVICSVCIFPFSFKLRLEKQFLFFPFPEGSFPLFSYSFEVSEAWNDWPCLIFHVFLRFFLSKLSSFFTILGKNYKRLQQKLFLYT